MASREEAQEQIDAAESFMNAVEQYLKS